MGSWVKSQVFQSHHHKNRVNSGDESSAPNQIRHIKEKDLLGRIVGAATYSGWAVGTPLEERGCLHGDI